MAENILSAEVAVVSIGNKVQAKGLKLENGKYAVSVQQAAKLFQVPQNNAQRDFKALLGKDIRFLKIQVKNAKSRKAESCLSLDDFRLLIRKLDKKGNQSAERISDLLIGVSLEQLFADAFNVKLTKSDRQSIANRISDIPSPWERMYDPEFCKKAFSMFGSNFYWLFCYNWMTQEERCKVNRVNPVVNGKRDAKIHQFLDTDTRKRLTPYVAEMVVLIDVANSKEEFSNLYARRYGANQLNLL